MIGMAAEAFQSSRFECRAPTESSADVAPCHTSNDEGDKRELALFGAAALVASKMAFYAGP
jgi:hypothetical protein